MARDQVPNRCVRAHDRDRGPSLVGLHAASRNARGVAERPHDPVHLQLPELRESDCGVDRVSSPYSRSTAWNRRAMRSIASADGFG